MARVRRRGHTTTSTEPRNHAEALEWARGLSTRELRAEYANQPDPASPDKWHRYSLWSAAAFELARRERDPAKTGRSPGGAK